MAHHQDEIADRHPALRPLTDEERRRYLRRSRAQEARDGRFTGWVLIIVMIVAGLFVTGMILVAGASLLSSLLYADEHALAIALLVLAFLGGGFAAVRFTLALRRARRANQDRALREHLLRLPPVCMGCGYDLAGTEALRERPGVIRCPECAMANPAPAPSATLWPPAPTPE